MSTPATLVAVTGVVGIGKTTLATALASALEAEPLLEAVGPANPWLTPYYTDPARRADLALPLQLHYLTTTVEALHRAHQAGGPWVADQSLAVAHDVFIEALHAEGILSDEAHVLFERTYALCHHVPGVRAPDVLVYLTGPASVAEARRQHRAAGGTRPGEVEMDARYWAALGARYDDAVARLDPATVVRVDVRDYDVRDPVSLVPIVNAIRDRLRR